MRPRPGRMPYSSCSMPRCQNEDVMKYIGISTRRPRTSASERIPVSGRVYTYCCRNSRSGYTGIAVNGAPMLRRKA